MIYGYIRVSTDKQCAKNQQFEILNYCLGKGFEVNEWIEETISSTKALEHRKFGGLLNQLLPGDILLISEISRMGRNLLQIMSILHKCMEMNVLVYAIKERYELGNNINSKVLAFAFGLSAEIERNLISQRTKEALARKKAEGVILGRPKGRKSSTLKLSPFEKEISEMLKQKASYSSIARLYGVHRLTVSAFAKNSIEASK